MTKWNLLLRLLQIIVLGVVFYGLCGIVVNKRLERSRLVDDCQYFRERLTRIDARMDKLEAEIFRLSKSRATSRSGTIDPKRYIERVMRGLTNELDELEIEQFTEGEH